MATRQRASAVTRRRRVRSIRLSSCAVDVDGNETAGIRMPDIAVPVGTHAGWNPRDPVTGSPDQIVPMNKLALWFAPDQATRVARCDPRRSVAERYRDEADYSAKVRAVGLQLVAERYLLEEDVPACRRGGRRTLSGCGLSVV